MTSGVYVLSCRLTFGPLWLGIFHFLWWFLLFFLGYLVLHGHMSFHVKPNFQNSIIYALYVVLVFLSCPSTIRVRVRQGSFWLEFCHSPLSRHCVHLYLLSRKVGVSIMAKCLHTPNVYSRYLQDWIFHLSS